MMQSSITHLPEDVAIAQRRLDEWRQSNAKRCRIPPNVWAEATTLAKRHGVSCVAGAMRLKHRTLREYVSRERTTPNEAAREPKQTFVEFVPSESQASDPGIQVEIERQGGERMLIRSVRSSELAALVSAFVQGSRPCSK